MKKKKTVILAVILAVAATLVGLLLAAKQTEKSSIFDYCTASQILEAGNKRAIDDSFKFTGIEEFGYTGDGEIESVGESVESIRFITNLSTESDNRDAEKLVKKFVKDFSDFKKFKIIENPIILQYCDEETYKNKPEDNYFALTDGYVLFEYSYRDLKGVLWIVQVFSPQKGCLSGLIVKQVSEEEFEGYEPLIDMRKESKNNEKLCSKKSIIR